MGEFSPSPPFSESPSFFLFSYPSNIEIIFDFSDIITKFTPPPSPNFKILDPPLEIGTVRVKCLAEEQKTMCQGSNPLRSKRS